MGCAHTASWVGLGHGELWRRHISCAPSESKKTGAGPVLELHKLRTNHIERAKDGKLRDGEKKLCALPHAEVSLIELLILRRDVALMWAQCGRVCELKKCLH
ncbi:hypothetical protein [Desulfosporosinus sp. OT]|uniref:hypothetical protein n=1 Tax=Desulfosporosinus sp. OT TaxID=913865 RepID=UPI00058D5E86|nr:hypothetical protein [Desulfosporosinus sp. OT]